MKKTFFLLVYLFLLHTVAVRAQTTLANKANGKWQFSVVKRMDALPVQDQNRSGTCWSFSSLSFFETELERLGKPKVNLSEMFVVNNAYRGKADMHVRMHGLNNFGPGGAFHDAKHVIKNHGIVPEEIYRGLQYGEEKIVHNEMDEALSGYVKAIAKNPNGRLTPAWKAGFNGILDAYLGELPQNFTFDGKNHTPQSYAKSLGLDMDDYVEIGSYTHHPFYESFVLEIPDNWTLDRVYNLPINEFADAIRHALEKGFTVAWAADVSDKGFSFGNGVAVVPAETGWKDLGKAKIDSLLNTPHKQLAITQEARQAAFDNWETTDDHGMHITGLCQDQLGQPFYIVKNSWGAKSNECDGYFFASESYVLLKTTCIMVHKDALPKELRKKLKLDK
jgi:bleomycin hydrolase